MATEKATVMVLKVDLQCPCCYKKIKKTLCKFPQIRDQVYDEKANTVTITVICCSPERIRDKLCFKGGKVIKSIEIKEPPKPKEAEKPKVTEKPKEPEKPKEATKPKEPEKPKEGVEAEEAAKPKSNAKGDKPPDVKRAHMPKEPPKAEPPKAPEPAPKAPAPALKAPEPAPKAPEPAPKTPESTPIQPLSEQVKVHEPAPVQGYPPVYPTGYYYGPCYEGYPSDPFYNGYGRPVPPPPSYDNRNYGYGYGYGHPRGCYLNKYDYFSEENPQACSIM